MKKVNFLHGFLLIIVILQAHISLANNANLQDPYEPQFVLVEQDTNILGDRFGDFINNPSNNPFDLNDPSIIEQEVEYDPETDNYMINERIGDDFYRMPSYMTFDEYFNYRQEQEQKAYFQELSGVSTGYNTGGGLLDPIKKFDIENNLIDRLFGGTAVDIRPQGNIDLTFGVDFQRVENPILPLRTQRQGGFDFDMDIQMSVTGKIGEKLNLSFNYNTNAVFDFDNQMKLDYNSAAFTEDDILKRIEAGNVSLPLQSNLIQGSQNLFGILAELQFGKLRLTTVASQQNSEREEIQLQGGSQLQEFEVRADEYDENRHFFLSHFNRDNFENALRNIPQINTLFNIRRIEVWVTNDRNVTQNIRDIVAVADLGEPTVITNDNPNFQAPNPPRNLGITGKQALPGLETRSNRDANDIYQELINTPNIRQLDNVVSILQGPKFNFQQAKDFEKVSARLLNSSEYDYNPQLGFVSLNINLRPDQVLGVAFEYDYNGKTYRVGEFAGDVYDPDTLGVIFVKMLKSTTPRVDIPLWDLMMKNIYPTGAFQASSEDFRLDIFYEDPGGGQKRFIPDLPEVPLLQVFNLDNLNVQGDPAPDGVFDYVPGVTIFPRNGRIMFPVLEPFGTDLAETLDDPVLVNRYSYQELYDSTVFRAQEVQEKNRFVVRGSYKSSVASEISLGTFNLPRGSVIVRAGGQILQEGQDYEIDYNIGRVRILNDAILNSGVPINISFEDNSLFGFQRKTLLGLRADYEINENFNIGGTYMHLFERPFTQKVNIGDDPINNRVYGLDFNYSTDAPFITKALDFLPLLNTKEPSSLTLTAEFAALDPGHSNAINQGRTDDDKKDRSGVVYLDDFEGSTSSIDLRNPVVSWVMSSVPQDDNFGNNNLFPESQFIDSTLSGVNRARLNWYRIDDAIRNGDDDSDPYRKPVLETEVFPNFNPQFQGNNILQSLDLTYYPNERGPYNFDVPNGTEYSAGVEEADGGLVLRDPQSRWGGIMRAINTNNFEAANIEFIEFWLLNPFMPNSEGVVPTGGDLYINLGNISEDVLRDSRNFYENGLPTDDDDRNPDTTRWGLIPRKPPIVNAFDNDNEKRARQDVGFDGLTDEGERLLFDDFLNQLQASNISPAVVNQVTQDPANDNFVNFRDENAYDDDDGVYQRYSLFNNPQGNSPVNDGSSPVNAFTNRPDTEDINQDNTLNETEAYYQYRIKLQPGDPLVDATGFTIKREQNDYITDTVRGETGVWYRFKIPRDQFTGRVGGINDFRSIRFMRMYMTNWEQQVTLRFARLELVRNQWRRYQLNLERQICEPSDNQGVAFDLNAVNIEENSTRAPFNYVLPNGIEREQSIGAFPDALQNEQSLSVTLCNMQCPNDAKAIFKIINFDMRLYERLRMFVHAESDMQLDPGDMSIFLRLGSDATNNFYEYEIPLVMSEIDRASQFPSTSAEYVDEIWRPENEFDFPLELLKTVKKQRNSNGSLEEVYEIDDPDKPTNKVKVLGNPNLGYVKSVMVGLRNRSGEPLPGCVEVWINELRVAGLDERGGVAGLARMDVKLADLGDMTLAANYTSIGYGGLEQKVTERSREEIIQYDVATTLQLGKFLPEKSGISIPFYAHYSEEYRNPEFDPYDLDIPLKEKLQEEDDRSKRDSIKELAQEYTRLTSYNFTNVRKNRTAKNAPAFPWDISNFSFTYGYDQTFQRTPFIAKDQLDRYRAAIDYTYNMKPLYIYPFKKLIKKDKNFKWISQINFNPIPNSFSFSTNMDRQFQETRYRFTGTDEKSPVNTFFNKSFLWTRQYNLNWDLAKNLKLNFSANNNGVIDEPREFDLENNPITPQERRDSIWTNIKNFGRTKVYSHNLNLNYTLPLKNIPLLDWINVKGTYNANYGWNAAALNVDSLGNTVQNSQSRQLSADFKFESLYNKSKYLKKINRKSSRGRGRGSRARPSPRRNNSKNSRAKKSKKEREPSGIEKALIRPLMMLRTARMRYNEDFSTIIPGYTPFTEYVGLSEGFTAPGIDFVAGLQPNIEPNTDDWLRKAANNGWITENIFQPNPVIQNYTQSLDLNISIEPFNDFKIELDATRQYTENLTLSFKDTLFDNYIDPSEIVHVNPRETGSLTISYFTGNTIFNNDIQGLFAEFEDNRAAVSKRLGGESTAHDDPELAALGYAEGYGRYQQDVLIPAFLAAYSGKSVDDVPTIRTTQDFRNDLLPRLNWRVNYNGLSKLAGLKEIFTNINLTHGYQSTLTVNNFQTEVEFAGDENIDNLNDNFDFYSRFEIPNLVINEQFSPLIGIDVKLKNSMNFRFDFNKSRTLSMSFIDYQLSETKKTDYKFNYGFILKNVYIPFFESKKKRKERRRRQNDPDDPDDPQAPQGKDLNIQFNFNYTDDVTINHLLDQQVAEPTRGNRRIQISPSVDYDLNKRLNLRFFFEYSKNIPKTSASFPITNWRSGITVRFRLN